MDKGMNSTSELEQLRHENERLRRELAAAGRMAARWNEVQAAADLGYTSRLAASEARTTAAEVDAREAWARAAEIGVSLARRIAEGQARLMASQAVVGALQRSNEGLATGQAAIALREADLRAVIESAIDCAIVTTDRDGLVLAWNTGARRLFGWDEVGALTMDIAAVLPIEDRADKAFSADIAAALSGRRVSREGWLLRQDGSRIWAGIEAMAVRTDGAQEPLGVLWMLRDRSAARQAEVALRESEARLRAVLQQAPLAIVFTGRSGEILFCNAMFDRLWGRPAHDTSAMTYSAVYTGYHLDGRPVASEAWPGARAVLRGETVEGEVLEIVQASGRRILCWFAAAPILDPAGHVMGGVVLFRDVSEEYRPQEALRESEERFRGFAENSADVLWITNHDGSRLDYLSPAFEQTFGEKRDYIMADLGRFRELIHPEDRDTVAGLLPRALAGETAIAHYRVVRPSDGRVIHLRDTGFAIRGAGGAVARAAGIVQDITDLHDAATALEAEKERFRTLAEGIPELVWRSAARGRWTWASPQWEAYTGLDDVRSRDDGWLDALHPADREAAREAWDEAESEGLFQADFRLRHAGSGRYAWFQTRAMPFRDAEGTVEWIGACANIDDQIQAREALARSAEELEHRVAERTAELMAAEETVRQSQKMEAIGQLTGGIAHDFNNMLQGVSGALAMAQRRLAEGRVPDVTRYIQAAGDAATRAAGLTRRLLAFARRQRLDPRPIDADALIGGMGDLLRRTMGPSITVEIDLRDGAGQVVCDPSELESAVLNLCINARDAMPQGGRLTVETTDVRLTAADLRRSDDPPPGDYVSIRIEDTGTGMTPEVLERILEPFFTTKPQGEGTGLGLSQVHGFVRQSGGLLRIISAPGQGTTIRIMLPLTPPEAQSANRDGPAQAAVQRGRGQTVLMVDDEAAVRGPAAEHLRDLGYRVVEANDGPTALSLLDEGLRPDVLVTDVGMPNGMDGRAMTEEVQRRLPGLPVIFVTGYARVTLPANAMVVTKPFDLDLLARRMSFVFARDL